MSLGKKCQTKKKEVGKLEHIGSIRERFMALINIIYTYPKDMKVLSFLVLSLAKEMLTIAQLPFV